MIKRRKLCCKCRKSLVLAGAHLWGADGGCGVLCDRSLYMCLYVAYARLKHIPTNKNKNNVKFTYSAAKKMYYNNNNKGKYSFQFTMFFFGSSMSSAGCVVVGIVGAFRAAF